jgi:hypothetical protein
LIEEGNYSSEELSFLSSEDKQKIIINMAYVHLDRELKKGKKITEIAHHPIIEVNNYLFNHR